MARNNDRDRGSSKRTPKESNRKPGKKKPCPFCRDKSEWVDYKDVNMLRRFMSDRGKIRARRVTGNCAQHQREVASAIKLSRELALLPYANRTVAERASGRGPGRPDRPDRPYRPDRRSDGDDEASLVDLTVPAVPEGAVGSPPF